LANIVKIKTESIFRSKISLLVRLSFFISLFYPAQSVSLFILPESMPLARDINLH